MKSFALQGFEHGNDAWRHAAAAGDDSHQSDFCSREGAGALKAKIEAFWRERGQDVMLSLHNVGFHPAIRAARYDVRSDMINGMPRSALAAAGQGKEHVSYSVSMAETDSDDVWIDD